MADRGQVDTSGRGRHVLRRCGVTVMVAAAGVLGTTAVPAGASTGPVVSDLQSITYPTGVATDSDLVADSCTSLGSCLAVGSYETVTDGVISGETPVVMVASGGGFSPVPPPVPSGPGIVMLSLVGVSCPPGGPCEVVGNVTSNMSEGTQGVVFARLGSTWQETVLAPVTSGDTTQINSISCPSSGRCVAAGSESSTNTTLPLIESLDDGAWTPSTPPAPDGNQDLLGPLVAVSCPSAGSCVAVGSILGNFYADTLAMGSWTSTSIPGGGTETFSGTVLGISCPSLEFCVAVGGTGGGDGDPNGAPLAVILQGGTWSLSTVPGAVDSGPFQSVSCPGAGTCVAVGGYVPSSGNTVGGLADGRWSVTGVPNPIGPGSGSVTGVSCPAVLTCIAVGSSQSGRSFPGTTIDSVYPLTATVASPTQGYLLATSNGGVSVYGTAQDFGSMAGRPLDAPVVGLAETPDGAGYWLVASDGGVFTFGDAPYRGSAGTIPLVGPIVGMDPTPDGKGYWLVASDGGVFAYGDAHFFGSTGAMTLNQPIVAMASTPTGNGYWLFAADGGVFAFGGARYDGSLAGIALDAPVVGAAATPDGRGYWMVGADGGVFTFGDAGYFGSAAGRALAAPVVGLAPTVSGLGYRLVESGGGVFTFGDAEFWGPQAGTPLPNPVVGLTTQAQPPSN